MLTSLCHFLNDHEELPARKRKLSDVDMHPHIKSLLATSLGEVVTLLVGDDPESKDSKFFVHKNILCAELQGTEGSIIRLPEEQPEVIRTFVHLIYVDQYICLSLATWTLKNQRIDQWRYW
ncbi:predicted protein [Sclerotinia sclerotiorum 1980 UF-70]|uniref:BTB domain-containing protein n=1 Tax=Sclerotinia sclerotiorum (strain ATCC 18683 / 1980 / Ss-1) TaxID=665079 RepID=A7EQY8_SCLS1|nr:predicted protein [Sclerotinia sclerotiorum 1980 UF-70]EDN91880.1 predicted protein [Sclerotinia sclerotiorum 1980 UF-70]